MTTTTPPATATKPLPTCSRRRWLRATLAIRKQLLGEHSLLYAIHLGDYAHHCYYPDQVDQSIALSEKALTTQRRALGHDHPLCKKNTSRLQMYYQIKRVNESK